MMLRILTLSGEELEIDVDPTDKILKIKEKLEEKEGIPPFQQRKKMLVKVLTITGTEYELDVDPNDKIARIKQMLSEKENVPPVEQRLIYQGKKLKDDETVQFYKLVGGTVLHLVVALRGGLDK